MSEQESKHKIADLETKITALEAELKDVKKQNYLRDKLFELNPDAVFVKNSEKELVYANKAILKYYEQENLDELLGTKIDQTFSKEQMRDFQRTDKIAITQGRYQAVEKLQLNDGTVIVAEINKSYLEGLDGSGYVACNVKDISEKEKLIANLQRSNDDLDNFAYVASHDLRAPLNAIRTMVEWVLDDCNSLLPSESVDNLQLVLNRAGRMDQLLRDLLEYSRIGRKLQDPSTFNLRSKILEWLNLVDLPMGFGIRCDDIDVTLPEMPLNVIMVNLISNAIKHHDSVTANIGIKVKVNKRQTVIEVADDGPGVPDEFKDKVFELFQTLKARDEVEASGMGLSVVKKLIEHYGGVISIKDNQPRGCRFIMHWPHQIEKKASDL